jgi:hypothetical protein
MKDVMSIATGMRMLKQGSWTLLLLLAAAVGARAQQLKLGSNPTRFDSSAALEIESQKLTLLLPRINDTATLVKTMKNGSLIYFTNQPAAGANKGLYVRSSGKWNWLEPSAGGASWSLTGNGGTSSGVHFLGATDNHPLLFKTNNLTRMFVDSITGNTGFSTTTPDATLHNQGSTLFGVKALANFAANATIGTALNTVDSFTVFSIPQTTAGRTLSLPAPTQTTAGRIAVLLNTGTAAFTAGASTVNTGTAITLVWTGAAWILNGDGINAGAFTVPYTYKPNSSLGMLSNAGAAITTGAFNIAIGANALLSNTTGSRNVVIGHNAFKNTANAIQNVAIGLNALQNATGGNQNVAIGANALIKTATNDGVAAGHFALRANTTGIANTAGGYNALVGVTTGGYNTAVGQDAFPAASVGSEVTGLGNDAGTGTSGSRNTAIGQRALYLNGSTTNNATAIGYNSGNSSAAGTTHIGANVLSNTANVIMLGSSNAADATNVGIGLYNPGYKLHVNGSVAATSYTNTSDGRLKKTVLPVQQALDKIKALRAVTFYWNQEAAGRLGLNTDTGSHYGFIAQEVEQILPQVVHTGTDSFQVKTIAYADIIPVLTEAMKERQALIEHLQQKNKILRRQLALLQQQWNRIQQKTSTRQ